MTASLPEPQPDPDADADGVVDTAPPATGPTLSELLDGDDLGILLLAVKRYCERHGLDDDTKRSMGSAILAVRFAVEPQFDEDGSLVGHLLLGADHEHLIAAAREVMLDYVRTLDIGPSDRPFRLV